MPGTSKPLKPLLVVEDDLDLTDLVSRWLARDGFTVTSAANGREALQLLQEEALPGLVLVDLIMPIMSGYALIDAMQASPDLRHIPIVGMSGHRQSTPLAGVVETLLKPFEEAELRRIVKSAYNLQPKPGRRK